MDIIKFENKELNWDDFREWFKKKFGWYPNADMPIALRLYLKEKEQGINETDRLRKKR